LPPKVVISGAIFARTGKFLKFQKGTGIYSRDLD